MQKSDIQFLRPCLTKLDFTVNPNFKNNEDNCTISIQSQIGNSVIDPNKSAVVSLNLKIGSHEETQPFYLEIEFIAQFTNESGDEILYKRMVEQNGPALLLSYARPVVSLITGQSGMPPFYLPFMNFIKDEETDE